MNTCNDLKGIAMRKVVFMMLAAMMLSAEVPLVMAEDAAAEKLFAETKRQAEAGDAHALYLLAEMHYREGWGVPKDDAKAMELLRQAAAKGDAEAQSHLAGYYLDGKGEKKDIAKALELYQKAAAQGEVFAQFSLGLMYESGKGVSKDKVLAYAWYNLAAAQADKTAIGIDARNWLEDRMTATELAEGQRLSSKWKKGGLLKR